MSTPKILRTQEVLNLVKEKLLQQENNIEVLEQSQFKSKISALPALNIESLILYKNLKNNCFNIVLTESLEIKRILNTEEFKEILSNLPSYEQKKLERIFGTLDVQNISKAKLRIK